MDRRPDASPLLLALVLILTTTTPLEAQDVSGWSLNAQYSAVLPIGEATQAFADGLSWRGATIDIERRAGRHVSLGASFGWHVLAEENTATSVLPDGALSGRARRYVNSVPMLLSLNLLMGSPGGVRPYIGGGAGTFWIENRTETSGRTVDRTNWHLGVIGEAGVILPRPGGSSVTLSARYNKAFETNGVEREYLTFSLGYLLGS